MREKGPGPKSNLKLARNTRRSGRGTRGTGGSIRRNFIPHGVGKEALAGLNETEQSLVGFITVRVLDRQPISTRILARQFRIRMQTANQIVHPKDARGNEMPGWIEWAHAHLASCGNGLATAQVSNGQALADIEETIRETLGKQEQSGGTIRNEQGYI